MKSHRLSRIAGAVVVALGMTSSAFADDTASSIRGVVTAPDGTPAANTSIIVTHMPSGTVKRLTTNESGAFQSSGLRVGGPYKIVVDSDVYQDQEINNQFLQLGKTERFSFSLEPDNIESIVVTASRADFVEFASGSESTFGADEIARTPSFSRDIKDVVRQNPLVVSLGNSGGELTVAGSNPKFNSLTVDGVRQDDDFGLNGNGYPTLRSPISIDALEQVTIQTNPFSSRYGGFSGAQINAVTKSGTNEFKGSFFYEFSNDSLAGDVNNGEPDAEDIEFDYDEKTYGFSLGGPIIKDKLFFFANYEKFSSDEPLVGGPIGSSAEEVADVTQAEVDEVVNIAREVYGVDAGDWNLTPDSDDEKLLLKLDWNINDDHRAAFTFQNTESSELRNNGGGDNLHLSSHMYREEQNLETYAFQFYSNWSDDLSTNLKIAYKDSENVRSPLNGADFGEVEVETPTGGFIRLGRDEFRHANELTNETLQLSLTGEYLAGDHVISFGVEYDSVDVFNLFVDSSLGKWTFDNIDAEDSDDIITSGIELFRQQTATEFTYRNSPTGNVRDAGAEFKNANTVLYVEDSWDITEDFNLTYGVRYERLSADDTPTLNQNFVDRYGFANTENLDGESLFLPRVGFDWYVNEDLTISGGVGKYSGGRPNVWISNGYTNTGIAISDFNPDLASSPNESVYLNNVNLRVPAEVQASLVAGDGNTTPIDPDFKLPTELRYSLALDYDADFGEVLGDNYKLHTEVIFTRKEDGERWVDLSRVQIGTTADGGRPIYRPTDLLDTANPNNRTDRYDLMLTNTDETARSFVWTNSIGKQYDNGLNFNASYTYQDIEDVVPGTSSRAESNYQFLNVIDRQNPTPGTAAYEVEHRLTLQLGYETEFFSGYATRFNLFWERRSGRPFSYTLGAFRDGDLGDQSDFDDSDNYLAYIPTGPNDPNVVYDRGLTYEQLLGWIQDAGLEGSAGGYASRGSNRAPWTNTLDFRMEQEFPGAMKGHKGLFYVDVKNLLAVFDEDAGRVFANRFGENARILVDYDINEQGQYVYSPPFRGVADDGSLDTRLPYEFRALESAWQVKVGVKYTF